MIATREGEDIVDPTQAIYGPKMMIINQFAGFGGYAIPWYLDRKFSTLMNGGFVTAPRWAFYGLSGEWEVENHGISPDIEVEQDPKIP